MTTREKLARAEALLETRRVAFDRARALVRGRRRSWGAALAVAFAVPYGLGFAFAWNRGESVGMRASAEPIAAWTASLDDAGATHAACREETLTYQGAWTACREEQTSLAIACQCTQDEPECGCAP